MDGGIAAYELREEQGVELVVFGLLKAKLNRNLEQLSLLLLLERQFVEQLEGVEVVLTCHQGLEDGLPHVSGHLKVLGSSIDIVGLQSLCLRLHGLDSLLQVIASGPPGVDLAVWSWHKQLFHTQLQRNGLVLL